MKYKDKKPMDGQGMYRKRTVGRYICAAAGIAMAALLTACGGAGENTRKAMQMIQALDYRGALAELDTAEENRENGRLIARTRGIAYMGLTDYENAVASFQQVLAGSNGLLQDIDFDVNYYLAAAYTKNGEYQRAEDIYTAILALRPGEKDAYFLRGNVRMTLTDYDGAIADFETVIAMAPKDYDRLIEIHQVLDYYGCGNVGQEYLRKALETGDKQMSKYVSGRIYFYLGEYQNAYTDLEASREKEKGGLESYLYLGRAYEATGDYNYAINVYNSYLSKKEGCAEMYNQLGLCYMTKGEYASALEAFQAGLSLEDGGLRQTLSFNEIVAREHLGDFEQARTLMAAYLKNYPDDQNAKREYDFLSTR